MNSDFLNCRYDLLYEWLFEIRSKIFLSEYVIVWATFLAIQVVGMDAGIVIGVLVSIVDHVVHSAKSTGVNRVYKRSRAVWTPEQHKLLQDHGYHLQDPKIVTLGKFVYNDYCVKLCFLGRWPMANITWVFNYRSKWERIFWIILGIATTHDR